MKDSASFMFDKSMGNSLHESNSDLSSAKSGSCKSECGDEVPRGTSIILDGSSANNDHSANKQRLNGQVVYSASNDDIYKKNSLNNGKVSTQPNY